MRSKERVGILHGSSAIRMSLVIVSCTKSICVWTHRLRASLSVLFFLMEVVVHQLSSLRFKLKVLVNYLMYELTHMFVFNITSIKLYAILKTMVKFTMFFLKKFDLLLYLTRFGYMSSLDSQVHES